MTPHATRKRMRWALPALLGAVAIASAACLVPGATTTTHLGFTVGVDGAPPPPAVVVAEPPVVQVDAGVYVVNDPSIRYDMFRYGSTWYLYSGGYWYQAASPRGPYAVVDVRYVPQPVLTVPPGRWKHHPHGGPPGLARGRERRED